MRGSLILVLGLIPSLAGLGCNLIADIQEGVLIGAAGGGGMAGSAGSGEGGQGGGAGGSTSQGGAPACTEPAPSDACAACLFESCQERYCACEAEPECGGLVDCTAQGYPVEFCWQKYADGISLNGSLQECGATTCPICGFSSVSDCDACQYTNCAMEVNACYSSADCYGFLQCYAQCTQQGGSSSTCSAMCSEQYMAGVPLVQALVECQQISCPAPCGP